jgi:predicted RNA-binding protein with PUA-like domain
MKYWLLKSEPDVFSIDNLYDCKNHTEPWDGIRNYQARNFMRDEMKINDQCFFYHSNCKTPGIVGIMTVVSNAYSDKTQFDKKSKYYDPKSKPEKPTWVNVDVKFKKKYI